MIELCHFAASKPQVEGQIMSEAAPSTIARLAGRRQGDHLAGLYSLIATCDLHDVDPLAYLDFSS